MGYIKKTEPSKAYQTRRSIGNDMDERRDCTVIAVSIACQVSYKKAHKALKDAGRRDRCGCPPAVSKKAIKSLGYKVREWSQKEMQAMMASYGLPPSKQVAHITTHHPRQTSQTDGVSKAWKGVHKNIIFLTQDHMAAYRNHLLQDWSINRALRVIQVWEVDRA